MTVPSAQTLQRLANETGLQAGTLEKVLRLLDVLQEIARDPVLADRLVLKGGTALNVFHLAFDRLSVDIDLNYVGALDRAAMEVDRPEVDAALNRLLTAQGYAIRRQPGDLRRLRDHPTSPPLLDPQKPRESPSTPLAFLPQDPLTVTVR